MLRISTRCLVLTKSWLEVLYCRSLLSGGGACRFACSQGPNSGIRSTARTSPATSTPASDRRRAVAARLVAGQSRAGSGRGCAGSGQSRVGRVRPALAPVGLRWLRQGRAGSGQARVGSVVGAQRSGETREVPEHVQRGEGQTRRRSSACGSGTACRAAGSREQQGDAAPITTTVEITTRGRQERIGAAGGPFSR